jgi:plastocyanin
MMQSARALPAWMLSLLIACGGNEDAETPPPVPSCTSETARDQTARSGPVPIEFGGALGNRYQPDCVRIRAGQSIEWQGLFVRHALEGGVATSETLTPDPSSPIPATDTGETLLVTFDTAGEFPYYCVPHGRIGMTGTVHVVP